MHWRPATWAGNVVFYGGLVLLGLEFYYLFEWRLEWMALPIAATAVFMAVGSALVTERQRSEAECGRLDRGNS